MAVALTRNILMTNKYLLGVALGAFLFATGAQAATITNNETQDQIITLKQGDRSESYTIAPSGTLNIEEGLCPNECVLALPNGDEFDVVRGDELILEEGGVYLNPPAQGSANEPQQNQQQ